MSLKRLRSIYSKAPTVMVCGTLLMLAAGVQSFVEVRAQTDFRSPAVAPSYKTAWPKQVPVLKPDPVMGESKFWEYWVYDKTFAERFQGFDPARANPELNPGVYAIVFRAYKEKIFDPVPEMFRCEYEVYFDSRVQIPLGELEAPRVPYPSGVTYGFQRLRPNRTEDAKYLQKATQARKGRKSEPLIMADGRLDGRYAKFGLTYFPDLVPGISMAKLGRGGSRCEVIAPKRPGSYYWIWLFGELSYNNEGSPLAFKYSDRFSQWTMNGTFDPGPVEQTLAKGHVRVPEAFYEAVLSKVTLIKAVNLCIIYRNGYEVGRVRDINGSKAQDMKACEEVEREGAIYDIGRHRLGWQSPGF